MNLIVEDKENFEAYHIYPPYGLLNDPNGLVYFNGQYHVFYQWNPKATDHKYKVWAHMASADLVNWHRLPVALEPSLPEDKSGIYSGTAIVVENKLYVVYTGNVRNDNGESIASYQMLAVSDDGINFTKLGKLFDHPQGFTRHVRDPKIFKVDATYFLLLGAQREDLTGDIIVYSSVDLHDWEYRGSLIGAQLADVRGYMIECPDITFIDGHAVLMFSPQGLQPKGNELQNIHNTGYVLGEFNAQTARFKANTAFKELDRGFEFYASQTLSHNGNTLLWGWAGMMSPERELTLPTINDNWAHVLSVPRLLTVVNEQLKQAPISALGIFKKVTAIDKAREIGLWSIEAGFQNWELVITPTFKIKRQGNTLIISRKQWENNLWEHRQVTGDLGAINLVVDHDVIDIFTASGEFTMTARYFDRLTKK